MNEYHKIQTVFKRDMGTKHKTLLEGQFSLPEFEYLADNAWVFTEKVDGTNIRVMLKNGAIVFGGKTDAAQIPAQLVAVLNDRFLPLASRMQEMFSGDACLYGEGYGAKIQKGGGNYRPDQDFVLFDVRVGDWWLQRADVEDVAAKLGINVVPIVGVGTLHDAVARKERRPVGASDDPRHPAVKPCERLSERAEWRRARASGAFRPPRCPVFRYAGWRRVLSLIQAQCSMHRPHPPSEIKHL